MPFVLPHIRCFTACFGTSWEPPILPTHVPIHSARLKMKKTIDKYLQNNNSGECNISTSIIPLFETQFY